MLYFSQADLNTFDLFLVELLFVVMAPSPCERDHLTFCPFFPFSLSPFLTFNLNTR